MTSALRNSTAALLPNESAQALLEGDRVWAPSRPGFPAGTVMKLLTQGYALVRWDANVLETAHRSQLDRVELI